MYCLKTAAFAVTFGFVCAATSPLQAAALPLIDKLQQWPESHDLLHSLQPVNAAVEASGRGILNGYKGYRHHRPGYQRHSDGWWYPRDAFTVKKNPVSKAEGDSEKRKGKALPERHVRWCQQKYLSWRWEDNTFQPYEGPRRTCRSPYLRRD